MSARVVDEEQTAYQEALRGWLADTADSATVRGWLDDPSGDDFHERLVAEGWAGVGLDEDLGGQGGGLLESCLTAAELARVAAPSSTWLATTLAGPALRARPDVARAALEGEGAAWAVDCSHPIDGERGPARSEALTLAADGRVSGVVPRVLAGAQVRWLLVPVGDVGALELFVVDATGPGVSSRDTGLLDRSRRVADITFEAAPAVRLTDTLDDAAVLRHDASLRAGMLVAADAFGASERMLEMAVAYSRQRSQFGQPIGSFQAVKHAAATMLVGVEAARSVITWVAASVEAQDPEREQQVCAVKSQVTAEAARAADSALTLHGAIGYTWEHDLQLFYKRAKLDEHLYGAPRAWDERLADCLDLD